MEEFLTNFEALMDAIPGWITALTTMVAGATAVTALTPTQADDRALNYALRFLNILAGNFGKNRNADDVPKPG